MTFLSQQENQIFNLTTSLNNIIIIGFFLLSENKITASGSPSGSPERASKSSSSPPDVSVNPLFGDLSDGDGDLAVPTQSYFDYTNNNNNNRGDDAGDGDASASATNIRGGGPRSTNSSPPPTNLLPISSTKNNNNNNKPPSTTKGRQGGPSWKTKTNDDNTIIDDESGGGKDRSGPGAAEVERQATQQLDDDARSIDGFPLAYPAHSSASVSSPLLSFFLPHRTYRHRHDEHIFFWLDFLQEKKKKREKKRMTSTKKFLFFFPKKKWR